MVPPKQCKKVLAQLRLYNQFGGNMRVVYAHKRTPTRYRAGLNTVFTETFSCVIRCFARYVGHRIQRTVAVSEELNRPTAVSVSTTLQHTKRDKPETSTNPIETVDIFNAPYK